MQGSAWQLLSSPSAGSETSQCNSNDGVTQVTKRYVEEAGQQVILLPGGLEDEEQIK